jgi:hypothetical protein
MTRPVLRTLSIATIAGWCCAVAQAQLVFDGSLLDAAGRLERVGVSMIRSAPADEPQTAGEITIIDSRGASRTRPLGDTIALVPAAWAEGQPSTGLSQIDAWLLAGSPFIELVDGQRFVGRPGRIGAEGETIAWIHERFGTLTLPIDEVSRLVMRPAMPGESAQADDAPRSDTILLANGDRLEGFLEHIGPRAGGEGFALTIDTGGGGNRITVPVDQVIRAQFANPRRAPRGPVAWLADGSVVGVSSIKTEPEKSMLLLTASAAILPKQGDNSPESPGASATAAFASRDVTAIVFDSARTAPLAQMQILSHRPIGLPRRPGPSLDAADTVPVPLGAADVLIPGPMEVEWAMPAGSARLIGTARLDEADWTWGECVVVVEVVSGSSAPRQVARINLGGSVVAAPLATELGATKAGDRLRIRIEPGELGPIRDRVRLERVLLIR